MGAHIRGCLLSSQPFEVGEHVAPRLEGVFAKLERGAEAVGAGAGVNEVVAQEQLLVAADDKAVRLVLPGHYLPWSGFPEGFSFYAAGAIVL